MLVIYGDSTILLSDIFAYCIGFDIKRLFTIQCKTTRKHSLFFVKKVGCRHAMLGVGSLYDIVHRT